MAVTSLVKIWVWLTLNSQQGKESKDAYLSQPFWHSVGVSYMTRLLACRRLLATLANPVRRNDNLLTVSWSPLEVSCHTVDNEKPSGTNGFGRKQVIRI